MKISRLALLALIAIALTACNDREDRERAINEGRTTPAQVSPAGQEPAGASDAPAQAEPAFAATCRNLEGSWNTAQQQCDVTAAACSNASGVWQAGSVCVLEMPEADCVVIAGMHFEESKCILRTISPDVAEVK